MSYSEELAKRRQDPEYRAVERELRPILDLADDVFNLRMERGWTQAELARLVGTKQANISRLENGEANPTIKFLQKLSKAFDTDLTVRLRPQPAEIRLPAVFIATDKEYIEVISELEYTSFTQEYITGEIVHSHDIGVM
jgi:transcriptional regulator with XRE-family HTH domain